jgi:hypothetical protein
MGAFLAMLLLLTVVMAATQRQQAYSLLYQAESELALLRQETNAPLIADLVDEARLHLDAADYNRSVIYSLESLSLLELALNTSQMNGHNYGYVESGTLLGWDMGKEKAILTSSVRAFEGSQFSEAYIRAQECAQAIAGRIETVLDSHMAALVLLDGQLSENGLASQRILQLMSRVVAGAEDGPELTTLVNDIRTANRSASCMIDAKQRIDSQAELMDTPLLDSLLAEAKAHFEAGADYTSLEMCQRIAYESASAVALKDKLAVLERDLDSAEEKSLNVEGPRALAAEAGEMLDKNRFAHGLKLAEDATISLEQLVSDDLLLNVVSKSRITFKISSFVTQHWKWMLISILVITAIVALAYNQVSIWYRDNLYMHLVEKKANLKALMEQAQRDYYVNKDISQDVYQTKMEAFQQKLLHVREQISLLRHKGAHADAQHAWHFKRRLKRLAKRMLDWLIDWAQRERKHLK